jgi:hypothetical protein
LRTGIRIVSAGTGQQPAELIRSSGHYGARVPVPDESGPQTRLLGFIGRDPPR